MIKKFIGVDDFAHQESPEQESRRVSTTRYGLEYGAPGEADEEADEEVDE